MNSRRQFFTKLFGTLVATPLAFISAKAFAKQKSGLGQSEKVICYDYIGEFDYESKYYPQSFSRGEYGLLEALIFIECEGVTYAQIWKPLEHKSYVIRPVKDLRIIRARADGVERHIKVIVNFNWDGPEVDMGDWFKQYKTYYLVP